MPKRHVSYVMAAGIFIGSILFISGYYLGKRTAAQELLFEMQQELLASSQHNFLTSLHDNTVRLTPEQESNNLNDQDANTSIAESATENSLSERVPSEVPALWQAHLAGWGSYKEAVRCAQLLKKVGMVTKVVKRKSTAENKVRYWYQVVSEPFVNKDELEQVVDTVSQRANIVGAKIVKVHNGGNERKNS